MPVPCVEISNTARNHTSNILRDFSSSVPEVRLVSCPQSAFSNRTPLRTLHTRLSLPRHRIGLLKVVSQCALPRSTSVCAMRMSTTYAS